MFRKLIKYLMYPHKYDSKAYMTWLKKHGAKIGDNTVFTNPVHCIIDEQNLPFIEIGSKCCITGGVTILAHDWSVCVIAEKYKEMIPSCKRTIIGDNVFIGMNSTILMGANIGNNTIIGAGSVVSGNVDSDSVYAGNPAHKIMTIDEYYNKCKNRYLKSAKLYAEVKKEQLGRIPRIEEMGLYETMFLEEKNALLPKISSSLYYEAYVGVPQYFSDVNELLNFEREL